MELGFCEAKYARVSLNSLSNSVIISNLVSASIQKLTPVSSGCMYSSIPPIISGALFIAPLNLSAAVFKAITTRSSP